jgi:hypothetical protein
MESVSGDRFEDLANLQELEKVRRFTRVWQALPTWSLSSLNDIFGHIAVEKRPLGADLFGFVVGVRAGQPDATWTISVNDRLPLAADRASLGHEYGHTFQQVGLGLALCAPCVGLPIIEQEAHAYGTLLTVPFEAVERLPLGDHAAAARVAVTLQVPATYVEIRRALGVFLGELPGETRDASAYLNGAMLRHQLWMARISDLMRAEGENPPV